MGDFITGNVTPGEDAANMRDKVETSPDGFETDVDGVKAQGMKNGLPVFDVEEDEFYNNMKADRKRLRFKSEAPVSQYLRQTRYNKPFFIKTPDNKFMRKVK